MLKSYNYIPSVQGGYDAIKLSVEQLAQIGILKEGTDAQQFTDNVYAFYDDVPRLLHRRRHCGHSLSEVRDHG